MTPAPMTLQHYLAGALFLCYCAAIGFVWIVNQLRGVFSR